MLKDRRVYKTHKKNKKANAVFGFIIKISFCVMIIFFLLSNFFIVTYKIDSIAMEPSIKKNDLSVAFSNNFINILSFFNKKSQEKMNYLRGDVILLHPSYNSEPQFPSSVFAPILKFITLNSKLINNNKTDISIKRIIGIPGDSIQLKNYNILIKPKNETVYIPETELIKRKFHINNTITNGDSKWKTILAPFFNDTEEIVLNDNEYFVLGDNRIFSNDSRSWGKISLSNIKGKIIGIYFPFNRFGSRF